MSRPCERTRGPEIAAPPPTSAEASKKRVVLQRPSTAASAATVSQGGVIIGFVGQLRGIVECLAGAFGIVEGNPADDADTRERLRRTCGRAQRF